MVTTTIMSLLTLGAAEAFFIPLPGLTDVDAALAWMLCLDAWLCAGSVALASLSFISTQHPQGEENIHSYHRYDLEAQVLIPESQQT